MAELMIVATTLGGQYPDITPVVTGTEFGKLAEKIMPAAQKLING
jgi:hypothetical protein